MFCATAETFNDPYDCALTFDPYADDAELRELKDYISETNDLNEDQKAFIGKTIAERQSSTSSKLIDDMNQQIRSSYKICSLSERADSLLMWAHYGDLHKGFVMEYDFTSLPPHDPMTLSLWPVIYDQQIYDATHIYLSALNGRKFNNSIAVISAMHKASDWEYEKEWRIVIPSPKDQPNQSFPAPLTAVHMGAKISVENEHAIKAIAAKLNIPTYKMKLSNSKFEMLSIPTEK